MDLFNHIQTFFYYNFTFWEETWAEVKKNNLQSIFTFIQSNLGYIINPCFSWEWIYDLASTMIYSVSNRKARRSLFIA